MNRTEIENELSKIDRLLESENDGFQRTVLRMRQRGLVARLDRCDAQRESFEHRSTRARRRRFGCAA